MIISLKRKTKNLFYTKNTPLLFDKHPEAGKNKEREAMLDALWLHWLPANAQTHVQTCINPLLYYKFADSYQTKKKNIQMPTIRQILSKGRTPKKKKSKTPVLKKAPQAKGVCVIIYVASPRKPNSANRKMAKVRLSTGKEITAYIPGEGHNLQENASVLVAGGGAQDTGSKLHIIRGTFDTSGVEGRMQGRSRYGAKRPKKQK